MAKNHQRRLEALERRLAPTASTVDLRDRLRSHLIGELLTQLARPDLAYDLQPFPADLSPGDRAAAAWILDAFERQVTAVIAEYAESLVEADRRPMRCESPGA